ncbi:MAG: hypothetical protein U5L11_02500 [Arhodomonas sp.]|nr:hypothetical protein [Arhodomonas sp.]
MGVNLNRIERGRVSRDANGWTVEEHAYVDGVTGDARGRAFRAATAPGLPAYGTAHPVVPGVFLDSINAAPEPGSTSQWAVTLIYRGPDSGASGTPAGRFGPATVELSSDVAQEETRLDINGRPLVVSFRGPYTRPVWVNGELVEQTTTVQQAVGISVAETSRPQLVLRVSRFERDMPIAVARDLTGRVNRSRWESFGNHTLLCTGVDTRPLPSGGHDVSYVFRHNPEGWRFEAAINLGFGANPPPEATLGNGLALYDVYETFEFNSLRLDI